MSLLPLEFVTDKGYLGTFGQLGFIRGVPMVKPVSGDSGGSASIRALITRTNILESDRESQAGAHQSGLKTQTRLLESGRESQTGAHQSGLKTRTKILESATAITTANSKIRLQR